MAVVEVVKYNGGPDVFAWKYPSEELGTWTQLIVSETQEAILFKGGKAMDVFGSGRHTLDTENIPLLKTFINLPFGGRSPFTAEIWYINKITNFDIKWGTPTPIQLQDPKYGVFLPVRSFGQFAVRISDSKKFLLKLVGTMSTFTKEEVAQYFRGLYITRVKDVISTYLIEKKISVLEINAYLDEISEYMKEAILPVVDEYGIEIVNFFVNTINVPEEDEAVIKLKNALAKKAEMDILGYNYQQERSFDTLEGAAKNTGSGSANFMGAGMGMGMGVGLGSAFGGAMSAVSREINTEKTKKCPKCGSEVPEDKRYCPDCGYDMSVSKEKSVLKCSSCGCAVSGEEKFCPKCGRKFNFCGACGNDIPDGAKACPKCGAKMPIVCPKCGGMVEAQTKFCPQCGQKL